MPTSETTITVESALAEPPSMTTFYVVSDVWMGQEMVVAETRADAERHQFRETLAWQGYTEEDDQREVVPEQFRAWPAETWPHHLEFAEAFEWIGEQTR